MTKEQQIKIQRCIDEFYSNRPQVRDELGAALQVLYEAEPIKHGRWAGINTNRYGDQEATCSVCGATFASAYSNPSWWDYCPNCGAKMDGGENEQGEPNCDFDWQGRYCIECLYSPTCYGVGIDKPACKAFVPRVRYVDCKDGGEK